MTAVLKVLICETSDDGTVGGSHTCMYNLVRHMDRAAIDVTVAFYRDNAFVPRYRDLGVAVKILPIREPVTGGNPLLRKARNWYRLEHQASRYVTEYLAREEFDLVLLNNSILRSLLFVDACRGMRIPLVSYERGFAPHGPSEVRASAMVACSIAISDAVRDHLARLGFRSRRIERIYDGLDAAEFAPARPPEALRQQLGIAPGSRVIGIVGNVKPWKGQKHFLEAFVALAHEDENLYALVIGACAEADRGFLAGLQAAVRDAGLERRALFLGYRPDVRDLLHVLDVFVHASVKPEPFGMVILEAMAARRPVIATGHGGPVEILDHGACGLLVPPRDGGAIAAACRRYLADPALVREMTARAADRLAEHFQIADTARSVTGTLARAVEEFGARGAARRRAMKPQEVPR